MTIINFEFAENGFILQGKAEIDRPDATVGYEGSAAIGTLVIHPTTKPEMYGALQLDAQQLNTLVELGWSSQMAKLEERVYEGWLEDNHG